MKSRTLGILCILLLALVGTDGFGGDIAHFQNLGFSRDSRYFMFGQFGLDEKTAWPYADLFLVHVPKNQFVPQGVQRLRPEQPVQPGYNGEGALFNLLGDSIALKKQYAVDHTLTGRLLYVLLNGEQPQEELQFRDFQGGRSYKVSLVQNTQGTGKDVRAAFHLLLTLQEKSGKARSFVVGLPELFRAGVKSYRVARILLAPDDRSLIFVMLKEEVDDSGSDLRFMVETADTGG